jgi:hypothetical protein
MGYWMIKGKRYTEEEYQEYERQEKLRQEAERKAQEEALQQGQAEAARLVEQLGEAYKACSRFLEGHPELCRYVDTEAGRNQDIYERLLRNLEYADSAPRCEYVKPGGTQCGSPRMTGYKYCYAHRRWRQLEPESLELKSIENANGIQQNLMAVMKALVDDQITEARAGKLLYGHHIASLNVTRTTFDEKGAEMVIEDDAEEAAKQGGEKKQALSTQPPALSIQPVNGIA